MSGREDGPDEATVRALGTQARARLSVARELHGLGHFEDAVSRAYYAAFHAATLLLYCGGLTFSSHAQLVGAFNREFVSTERLPKETAQFLRNLYELRQSADYDVQNAILQAESEQALGQAEHFIDTVIREARASYPALFTGPE